MKIELPVGVSEEEARLLLAVKLFEVGRVSLGQAAKIAALPKRVFLEILDQHKVPVFTYSPEDLRGELGP